MTHLNLSFNNLESFANTTFYPLTKLTFLDLSNNQLFSVNDLKLNSTSFTTLKLNSNSIRVSTIDFSSPISPINELTSLYLSNNNLTSLNFSLVSKLTTLDLSENKHLNLTQTTFQPLSSLETLVLNKISSNESSSILPVNLLSHQKLLYKLELRSNYLRNFDNLLSALPKSDLYVLDLTDNRFESLSNCDLTRMRISSWMLQLIMNSNRISIISSNKSCGNTKFLLNLDLSFNSLSSMENIDFNSFSSLNFLDLSNNPLNEIDFGKFEPLNRLDELNLNNIGIFSLPKNYLKSLKRMNLSRNRLRTLEVNVFEANSNLLSLNLGHNYLRKLPFGIFNGLVNLYYLYLNGNEVIEIDVDVFKGLNKLRYLDISNNQLTSIDVNLFQGLSFLTFLDLSQNYFYNNRSLLMGLENLKLIL